IAVKPAGRFGAERSIVDLASRFAHRWKRRRRSIPVLMPRFTPHQDAALNAAARWLKDEPGQHGTPGLFRLFGYAGTGKTTLARHLAAHLDGEVKFAAFTGKAALVMRGKGCYGATTIHSLIYRTRESGEE